MYSCIAQHLLGREGTDLRYCSDRIPSLAQRHQICLRCPGWSLSHNQSERDGVPVKDLCCPCKQHAGVLERPGISLSTTGLCFNIKLPELGQTMQGCTGDSCHHTFRAYRNIADGEQREARLYLRHLTPCGQLKTYLGCPRHKQQLQVQFS